LKSNQAKLENNIETNVSKKLKKYKEETKNEITNLENRLKVLIEKVENQSINKEKPQQNDPSFKLFSSMNSHVIEMEEYKVKSSLEINLIKVNYKKEMS